MKPWTILRAIHIATTTTLVFLAWAFVLAICFRQSGMPMMITALWLTFSWLWLSWALKNNN